MVEQRVGRERLFDAREVERVELGEVIGVGRCVASVGVDLERHARTPTSERTAATRSTSWPRAIFNFMLR